jgi:ribose transport system substrate-binding protein
MRARPFAGIVVASVSLALLVGLGACQRQAKDTGGRTKQVELAFLINAPSDFWTLAKAGIAKAERETGVRVHFEVPGHATTAEQKQIIEAMIGKGIKGMAISPLDSESQVAIINEAAAHMPIVTQDSDAPRSKRVAYVGTNNVEAGRQAGRLIKEILPKGGKIAVFVGKMDVANARERYAGIMEVIKGANIAVVTGKPYTDETLRPKAQENVRVALGKFPDLGCLVGLWSYNGPAIVKVVKEQSAKVPIVCFDEEPATLQGIRDGLINATVVQQPFEFGYRSIKLLAQLARGENPKIPDDGLMYVPTKIIRKDNVDAFSKQLDLLMAQGKT